MSGASDELRDHMTSEACRNLLSRYATAFDSQELEAFLDTFADDAVWTRSSTDPMHGRDQSRTSRTSLRRPCESNG